MESTEEDKSCRMDVKKVPKAGQENGLRTDIDMDYALALVSNLTITVGIIAGSFILLGMYLDDKLSTGPPIFLLLCLGLSVPVSIYDILWLLEPLIGSDKRKNFLKKIVGRPERWS
jgi:hypothetical protein